MKDTGARARKGPPIVAVVALAAEISRVMGISTHTKKLPTLQHAEGSLSATQGTLDPLSKAVCEACSQHRSRFKRTPLLSEIVNRLAKSCVDVDAQEVELVMRQQRLPIVTPGSLRVAFDECRRSLGVGIGGRITTTQFSRHLEQEHGIILRRGFLQRWDEWGDGVSSPPFKHRARGLDTREQLKRAIEQEYTGAEGELRVSKVLSRRPSSSEVLQRLNRTFGEFDLGTSGFYRLVRELDGERAAQGREALRFHEGRVSLSDRIERAHWRFIEQEGRSPTYHELASQLSKPGSAPVSWEVIRSAYRRINAYRVAGAPELVTQRTRELYNIEILKAHKEIYKPQRPPTIRELQSKIQANRPSAQFTVGLLRDRIETLRRVGHDLPTRIYQIKPEMVKQAYARVSSIVDGPPTLGEIRTVLLRVHPEVETISKHAIRLHLKLLRLNERPAQKDRDEKSGGIDASAHKIIRLPAFDRIRLIAALSTAKGDAFAPRQVSLMDRYELPEKRKQIEPVLYLHRHPRVSHFIKETQRPDGAQGQYVPRRETERAFLRAKTLWGEGFARATTTTPAIERLVRGTGQHSALSRGEWRALIAFTVKTLIPQMGLQARRAVELQELFNDNLTRIGDTRRDLRLIIKPSLKYHLRSKPRDPGTVTNLEVIDMALQRAFRAQWRIA